MGDSGKSFKNIKFVPKPVFNLEVINEGVILDFFPFEKSSCSSAYGISEAINENSHSSS